MIGLRRNQNGKEKIIIKEDTFDVTITSKNELSPNDIETIKKDLNEICKRKRRSIDFLALVGVILTTIFGIISLLGLKIF